MASYQVTVIDAEGTETTVEVPDNEYILDAIQEEDDDAPTTQYQTDPSAPKLVDVN